MKLKNQTPTNVYLMDSDHDVVSKKGVTIPDNEIIRDIQIRPHSVTIITTAITNFDQLETITRIHKFDRHIQGFKEVIP